MSNIKEDFLTVDKPIPGQNFVCMSFVSPEKILKNKAIFFMENFLKSFINKLNEQNINLNLEYENVKNEYDNYLYTNNESLEKQFFEDNNFHTSIRGLKVRGVYDTKREADIRAKVLQKLDSSHNVFIGQVGYWLPWDPDPTNMETEYLEDELNNLVKEYKNNENRMDDYYQQQTRDRAQMAKDQIDELIGIEGIFKNDPIPTNNPIEQSSPISTTNTKEYDEEAPDGAAPIIKNKKQVEKPVEQ